MCISIPGGLTKWGLKKGLTGAVKLKFGGKVWKLCGKVVDPGVILVFIDEKLFTLVGGL